MGKGKYRKSIEALFEKSPIVDYGSIDRIVKNKKKTSKYTKKLIHDLLLRNKAKRLGKGYYTTRSDPSLSVLIFQPAYLGLQDALSFHNLWEQETVPVIITAKKIRQGIRKILGTNVLIKRVNSKYLFGFNYENDGQFFLPYSDIEKTFIDMIYFKQPLDEVSKLDITKKINRKNLDLYLRKYPKEFRIKVLSFLQQKSL